MNRPRMATGFTLIELLVVIAIIAIPPPSVPVCRAAGAAVVVETQAGSTAAVRQVDGLRGAYHYNVGYYYVVLIRM